MPTAMHNWNKAQYSEVEAAEQLGITLTQLRSLVRSHVTDQDEDLRNLPQTTFQASDMLVLRLLAGLPRNPDPAA